MPGVVVQAERVDRGCLNLFDRCLEYRVGDPQFEKIVSNDASGEGDAKLAMSFGIWVAVVDKNPDVGCPALVSRAGYPDCAANL